MAGQPGRRYRFVGLQNLSAFGENFVAKMGQCAGRHVRGCGWAPCQASTNDLNEWKGVCDACQPQLAVALHSRWGAVRCALQSLRDEADSRKIPHFNYLYPTTIIATLWSWPAYIIKIPEQDSRFVVMSYRQDPPTMPSKPAPQPEVVRLDVDWKGELAKR